MSVSDASSVEYNKFFDEGASVYSDRTDSIIQTRVEEKKTSKTPKYPSSIDHIGIKSIFTNLSYCCAPRDRKDSAENSSLLLKNNGVWGAHTIKNIIRGKSINSVSDAVSDVSSHQPVVKGIKTSGEGNSIWNISADKACQGVLADMTIDQLGWCCCVWALRLENCERVTGSVLSDIIKGGTAQKPNIDISALFRNESAFSVLKLIKTIHVRDVRDAVSEIDCQFNSPEVEGAVYGILVAKVVLGVYAKKQGEASDISLFNVRPTMSSPLPCCVGFKNIDNLEGYLENIFNNEAKETKITVWILRSQALYTRSGIARNYDVAPPEKKLDQPNQQKADPKFQTKVVFGAMINATKQTAETENVFVWDAGTGMQVRNAANETDDFRS